VRTADGGIHYITEKACIPFEFQGRIQFVETLIAPGFHQTFLLGANFWKAFRVQPAVVLEQQMTGNGDKIFLNSDEIASIDELSVPAPDLQLTDSQRTELEEIKKTFKHWKEGDILGCTHLIKHHIDVGDHPGIRQKAYPCSPPKMQILRDAVADMVRKGVAVPCPDSNWSSPLTVVEKKDGRPRVCEDLRKVNAVTKGRDAYPIPRIDNILANLQGTKYITALDLKDAYWQVPLTEEAQKILAFAVPQTGLFMPLRMPFGCVTAPQTMVRLMDMVIGCDLEPFVFVYLDDIIVVTPTFEKHVEVLREMSKRLRAANLTITLEKSEFCKKELVFLGYVIDGNGIHVNPAKVSCIANIPAPKNATEARSFLGMATYYRRFIKDFAKIVLPLNKATRKNIKFEWTAEAHEAFLQLKAALIAAPVLVTPQWDKPFTIHVDASDKAMGAVLTQGDGEDEHPIAYMSKKWTNAQINYSTTDKECLGILWAIEYFRGYVEGYHFTVITDHRALLWLESMAIKSPKHARWLMRLSPFDFEVRYKKGKLHVAPDYLSRLSNAEEPAEILELVFGAKYQLEAEVDEFRHFWNPYLAELLETQSVTPEGPDALAQILAEKEAQEVASMDISFPTVPGPGDKVFRISGMPSTLEEELGMGGPGPPFSEIMSLDVPTCIETKDDDYKSLYAEISKNPKGFSNYRLNNGHIYRLEKPEGPHDATYDWKKVIPSDQRRQILKETHSSPTCPHLGQFKTVQRLKQHYYWPGMGTDAKEFIASCKVCLLNKNPNYITKAPMSSHPIPTRKMEVLCVDFAVELVRSRNQNTCFFMCVDLLTRFAIGYCARKADSKTMVKWLHKQFLLFGAPRKIISDNGKQFISKEYKALAEKWHITLQYTPYYHPQANPCERVIQTVKKGIRCMTPENQHNRWDEYFDEIMGGIRASVHEATKMSPYYMLFQQEMQLLGHYPPAEFSEPKAVQEIEQVRDKAVGNIKKLQTRNKRNFNRNARPRDIKVGDETVRKTHTLSNKANQIAQKLAEKGAKTQIVGKISANMYETRDENGKPGRYNAKDLHDARKATLRPRKPMKYPA
jgi:transposase InsO family protein